MKILLAPALLIALMSGASAKPSPYDVKGTPPPNAEDNLLYLGPAGAMLESDYFGPPQSTIGASRIFPCRLKLHVIDRSARFAQACD